MLFKRKNSAEAPTEVYPPRPSARRWIKPLAGVLSVALAIGSLVAWRSGSAKKDDTKPKAEKVFEFAAADLARLMPRDMGRMISVSGSVRPVVFATVKSKLSAEVARVHVQEGERVVAGQLLVTLDTADLRARLDAQLASLAEARARLNLADKTQETNQQLLLRNFISQNAVDTSRSGVDVGAANVKAAEAQVAIARRALDDAQVRAPFAGVVAKRMVNAGEKAAPDTALLQIVDLARMEIEALVPLSEIPMVRLGQGISFTVDGFDKRAFDGRVERISPAAESGSRSISVFVSLPNADGALKGGMLASGKLAIAARAAVNTVPSAALQEEGGQFFVFTVKDGLLDRRPVLVGSRSVEAGLVEITDGPPVGTDVVAVRAEGLKHGLKATLKSAAVSSATSEPGTPSSAPAPKG